MRLARKTLVGQLLLSALLVAAGAGAASAATADPQEVAAAVAAPGPCLERISPSVYAGIRDLESRFQETNSAYILTARGVVAVDPPSDRASFDCAVAFLRRQEKAEVEVVVFTHWHGDHTGGAGYFQGAGEGGGPLILGSVAIDSERLEEAEKDHAERLDYGREQLPIQREILRTGRTPSGREITAEEQTMLEGWIPSRQRWFDNHQEVRFIAPQVSFDSPLTLHFAPRIEILHLQGHTQGDAVVYLPEEGVMISGDLIDRIPFVGHGSLDAWVDSLATLAALDPTVIVPGHGPIFRGGEQIDRLQGYFAELRRVVASAEGEDPKALAEELAAREGEPLAKLLLPVPAAGELEFFEEVLPSAFEVALAER
jgi:glyoxylase-like metal-dependent hydrolase (beta-lactamase superfamily II)